MPQPSPIATSILVLLNNVSELIVQSNNRQGAQDVMRALNIYAKNKQFPMPEDKIENFHSVLLDARPYTLSSIVKDIAVDVIETDQKNQKSSKNTKKKD